MSGRPEVHAGFVPERPSDDVAALAVRAEDLGFAGVWVADSQTLFRDAFVTLARVAERTRRVHLATGVTNPVTRHPAVVAGSIATLQELSGGRAILGIGAGGSAVATVGLRPASAHVLEEAVNVIRRLLAGEDALLEGTTVRMSWAAPSVPIYLAASGPRSLRAAGRVADGVLFQVGAHPSLVRYAVEAVREGAVEAGRDPSDIRLFARLACSVSPVRERARAEARAYAAAAAWTTWTAAPHRLFEPEVARDLEQLVEEYDFSRHTDAAARQAELVTDAIVDTVSVSGTPDDVAPRLSELATLGVDGFVIPIIASDPHELMDALASDVMPHL